MPTVTTTKGKVTTIAPTMTKIDKDTPIIVASTNFNAASLNMKNTTPVQPPNSNAPAGITVVPMITTSVVGSFCEITEYKNILSEFHSKL